MSNPSTPLLDTVKIPADLRKLQPDQLRQLADELRAETIAAVGVTGGHLGSGLGVVELTTAIHYVFDTPNDKLVWDVGHQCYPHKILTGRRDRIRTLRQGGGLSGFTKRAESEYDPFGAAHSSTSISAALGFAVANKMQDKPGKGIAVIGDGAMSAGMAYEAMNNAREAGNRLVVILNDNDMSIAPPVGGLSAYLARLVSSREFLGLRDMAKKLARKLPRPLHKAAKKTDEFARGMATGGTLFEELGFYYVGPIDGHNLEHLIPVLENVRDAAEGPCLIHVVTQKGKGYGPAEAAADKYHGVQKFDVITGEQAKSASGPPSYTGVFANALATEAARDIVRTALAADVVQAHFAQRALDEQVAATRRSIATRGEGVGLQQKRYEAGVISKLDLGQLQSELAAAEAQLPALERRRLQTQTALAVLLGRTPREIFESTRPSAPSTTATTTALPDKSNAAPVVVPIVVPEGLPSDLLLRRPDIVQAEQRLIAVNARLAQARASLFPSITLTGMLGSQSQALDNLFTGPAGIWSLAAGVLQPIFQGGRLRAAVEAAESRERQTVIQYQQSIQNAFKEVRDALDGQVLARRQLEAESSRADRLRETYSLARLRYENGVASLLDVLDAERSLLAAELNRADALRAQRAAVADLFKALGGGWESGKQ